MFNLMKRLKKKIDDSNQMGNRRDSIKKKSDIADRIIAGEYFFERRIQQFPIQFERRKTS